MVCRVMLCLLACVVVCYVVVLCAIVLNNTTQHNATRHNSKSPSCSVTMGRFEGGGVFFTSVLGCVNTTPKVARKRRCGLRFVNLMWW